MAWASDVCQVKLKGKAQCHRDEASGGNDPNGISRVRSHVTLLTHKRGRGPPVELVDD
jgi:hypothetical protein